MCGNAVRIDSIVLLNILYTTMSPKIVFIYDCFPSANVFYDKHAALPVQTVQLPATKCFFYQMFSSPGSYLFSKKKDF